MKIEDAIKMLSRNKSKKEMKTQLCSGFHSFHCSSSSSSCQGCNTRPTEKEKAVECKTVAKKKAVTWKDKDVDTDDGKQNIEAAEVSHKVWLDCLEDEKPIPVGSAAKFSANMFSKLVSGGSFMPVAQKSELQTRLGKFEVLSAIVGSGAIVPVMNPSTGSKYDVVAASANGTEYEITSGDTLEDLGEKKMVVLTA